MEAGLQRHPGAAGQHGRGRHQRLRELPPPEGGQTISLLTPTGRHVTVRIVGIASDNARLLGDLTISRSLAVAAFGQREDALDFVSYAPGVGNAQVQPAVDRLLASAFPQVRSRTAAQFKQDQSNQINTLLTLIYVLLALSVIVSLFGIVNTLILSIYERTRELGMMRAIGTSPPADPPDDPLRVRDHGADRRRLRAGDRRDRRDPRDDPRAVRLGLRAVLPDRHARDPARDRGAGGRARRAAARRRRRGPPASPASSSCRRSPSE